MTPQRNALLRAAQVRFDAKTRDLSPRLLELRLRAMANREAGTEIDPIEKAMAARALDFIQIQHAAKRNHEAQEELRRSPPARMTKGEQLEQIEKLQHEQAALLFNAENVVSRPLDRAVNESVAFQREAEKASERDAALLAAAKAKAAVAVDPAAVDALAAALANRK